MSSLWSVGFVLRNDAMVNKSEIENSKSEIKTTPPYYGTQPARRRLPPGGLLF
jgi:hypothetical protein